MPFFFWLQVGPPFPPCACLAKPAPKSCTYAYAYCVCLWLRAPARLLAPHFSKIQEIGPSPLGFLASQGSSQGQDNQVLHAAQRSVPLMSLRCFPILSILSSSGVNCPVAARNTEQPMAKQAGTKDKPGHTTACLLRLPLPSSFHSSLPRNPPHSTVSRRDRRHAKSTRAGTSGEGRGKGT